MTIKALQDAEIPIKGIVFNGDKVQSSVDFILEYTQLPLLFSMPKFNVVNANVIKAFIEECGLSKLTL
jgi:dethiobiotin synthetase